MPTPTPETMERKVLPFEVKDVDLRGSTFTGFSAAMGNRDLGNDIIVPGAFKKTIRERVKTRAIKLLDNHNSFSTSDVWGTVVDAEEVKVTQSGENAPTHKLLTTFEVSQADPNAQTALSKIAERHLDQLSIGFRALSVEFEIDEDSQDDQDTAGDPRWAWIMGKGVRKIKEIQWWETSLVIWAMNPEAQILANSVTSLMAFAQKAAATGVAVPEDTVKQTIEALQLLTGERCPASGPTDDVRKAVSAVRESLERLDGLTVPEDAAERLHALADEFAREHGEDGAEKFLAWVTDSIDSREVAVEDDEEEEEEEVPVVKAGRFEIELSEQETETVTEEVEEVSAEDAEVKEIDVAEEDDKSALAAAVSDLHKVVGKLAEALDAEELEEEELSPDETASPSDPHVEEEEEAAKDAEPVGDGRAEHFPSGDELALELLSLGLLEHEARSAA